MKEYIEREALLEAIDIEREELLALAMFGSEHAVVHHARRFIEEAPAADVVERKRGEWVDVVYDPVWKKMKATCNSCHCRGEVRVKSNYCGFAVPDSDFCPNCGADMREVDHA